MKKQNIKLVFVLTRVVVFILNILYKKKHTTTIKKFKFALN